MEENDLFIFILIISLLLLAYLTILAFSDLINSEKTDETLKPALSPEKEAGNRGEKKATEIIRGELNERDHLLTNVEVAFQNKPAELDNVVVNVNGVFIIEVKNYSGEIHGEADDYQWEKYHQSGAGYTYLKEVDNPLKQVGRQEGILGNYLRSQGIDVWVRGYLYMVDNNSPVESDRVLTNGQEIRKAVHKPGRRRLSKRDIAAVIAALTPKRTM